MEKAVESKSFVDSFSLNELTADLYEIKMTYNYWKLSRFNIPCTFEVFFRKSPFDGEFAIAGGIDEAIEFIHNFQLSKEHIEFIKILIPNCEPEFVDFLKILKPEKLDVDGLTNGTFVFPREPILSITGPLGFVQYIETAILNIIGYSSLLCTNALRMRIAAGKNVNLIEMGCRRAQGSSSGILGAKYSFIGNFDGTSNTLASYLSNGIIKAYGTMAHSYILSFIDEDYNPSKFIINGINIYLKALEYRKELKWESTNLKELLAFASFAFCFPNNFVALVDTYKTLESGVKNFLLIALAMNDAGILVQGIRLDSGDLADLSIKTRKLFNEIAEKYGKPQFKNFVISASNDLHEDSIYSLKEKGAEINSYGIGTNLITCFKTPALGVVYKLVEIDNVPRIKYSEDLEKTTMPGRKRLFRIYSDKTSTPSFDLIAHISDKEPNIGDNTFMSIYSKFQEVKLNVERYEEISVNLLKEGKMHNSQSIMDSRKKCIHEKESFNPLIFKRQNPLKYPIYVTKKIFEMINQGMAKY